MVGADAVWAEFGAELIRGAIASHLLHAIVRFSGGPSRFREGGWHFLSVPCDVDEIGSAVSWVAICTSEESCNAQRTA